MFASPVINHLVGADRPVDMRPNWTSHPTFAGVRLARLVGPAESGGALTTLLVSLAPHARMEPHRHERQTEQHLVLAGHGRMTLQEGEQDYEPGTLVVIAEGKEHSVAAAEDGMMLLAVFTPASA
ncbi:MAG: cupin domain-containing protein [Ancalomicrobiaceae bacterium]|nr:cupin domain-containing protein [Ancalomicrobiaceae bacterium]